MNIALFTVKINFIHYAFIKIFILLLYLIIKNALRKAIKIQNMQTMFFPKLGFDHLKK